MQGPVRHCQDIDIGLFYALPVVCNSIGSDRQFGFLFVAHHHLNYIHFPRLLKGNNEVLSHISRAKKDYFYHAAKLLKICLSRPFNSIKTN